ncbi:biotin--[acetyl-CoA-carboxylase] ligase [Corynebacterium anserum]|uniref:biotin--[biotin carboxyl-carrier protein] ligase n=1 Tax=Corynebacterium anserum TaxID=2684406 RepID=A0A7G7YPR7_9CORY|nr:biotin--[acetyl-CoA-carboxylase] ligase [Corynebacterium anserum]MBC2682130.1 biotin--[acetyl-CoA-carboxylase] ligase [Corynebacterium anserum]QNH96487.1 biotin--[acetyl-CoA-carboxylase] ligase [Corynebacterium anserum]
MDNKAGKTPRSPSSHAATPPAATRPVPTDTSAAPTDTARNSATPRRPSLDPELLRRRLEPLGYVVEVVEQTGSTNTDLVERPHCPNATVRIAEEQISGRGRMGRVWTAPARAQLIVSVSLTCPEIPMERLGLFPLVAGLSITQGIIDATALPARLKWPNDVLVENRKLVGMLVEVPQLQPVPRVVIGFGVNYDLMPEELPVPHATSLALEYSHCDPIAADGELAAKEVPETTVVAKEVVAKETAMSPAASARQTDNALPSREEIAVRILTQLHEDVARFRAMGGAPMTFMSRYKHLSSTLGTAVKVLLPGDKELAGTAVDISDGGELVVIDEQGRRHSVAAGDVIHVRPRGGTAYSESSE